MVRFSNNNVLWIFFFFYFQKALSIMHLPVNVWQMKLKTAKLLIGLCKYKRVFKLPSKFKRQFHAVLIRGYVGNL